MIGNEVVPVEASTIVRLPTTVEDIVKQSELFQKLKAQLLNPKTDVYMIKGNPYIGRTGRCKLALAFNVSDELISEDKEVGEDGAVT